MFSFILKATLLHFKCTYVNCNRYTHKLLAKTEEQLEDFLSSLTDWKLRWIVGSRSYWSFLFEIHLASSGEMSANEVSLKGVKMLIRVLDWNGILLNVLFVFLEVKRLSVQYLHGKTHLWKNSWRNSSFSCCGIRSKI